MQLHEYDALEKVEREHWFYKGKRELVKHWIDATVKLHRGDRIVDAGAGTGELVAELRGKYEMYGVQVLGIEYIAEARTLARDRKGIDLLSGSILDLPLKDESAKVALALDVLEHVENDSLAFSELLRITERGGIVIINVPAFMSLWSEWDVSLGHYRRYTRSMLQKIIAPHAREFDVLHLEYANAAAFIPIWAYRKAARILKLKTRAEDRIPSPKVNDLMLRMFIRPSRSTWFHPPFGSSLFCVLRKK